LIFLISILELLILFKKPNKKRGRSLSIYERHSFKYFSMIHPIFSIIDFIALPKHGIENQR